MAPSPQNRNGRQRSRSYEEEYVVFLQGIPPQCRWQELKDLVRQTALHIRQAVVYDDCHGHPTGLGQIIIKNEDEAWRTYNRLSTNGWNGHSLTVTLSLANAPTKPIAGPTKCPSLPRIPFMPAYSAAPLVSSPTCTIAHDIPLSPVYPQSPEFSPYAAHITPGCHPHLVSFPPEAIGYQLPFILPNDSSIIFPQIYHTAFDPCGMAPHRYAPSGPMHHHYPQSNRSSISTSSNHSATSNIEPGVPASRHLFVQNLSPGTTSQQLRDYFQAVGTVNRCDVLDQRSFGRTKVCAAVSFQNEEEARRAISTFDNSTFMGVRIRVRFNRERSPSSSSQPKPPVSDEVKLSAQEVRAAVHSITGNSITGMTAAPMKIPREEEVNVGKKFGGPLVVNGSCVGMKAGRGEEDKQKYEDELSKRAQEIHL